MNLDASVENAAYWSSLSCALQYFNRHWPVTSAATDTEAEDAVQTLPPSPHSKLHGQLGQLRKTILKRTKGWGIEFSCYRDCLACTQPWVSSLVLCKPGMMGMSTVSALRKAIQVGGSEVQSHFQLHSEFKVSGGIPQTLFPTAQNIKSKNRNRARYTVCQAWHRL